ncbi:MAG: HAD-IA family hydrolase [Dehalococcoidales bacterium]|nr:HAD-IA family hydrolase [Dehalococcoidales bacterium]
MTIKAVIFDLFGTIVNVFRTGEYNAALEKAAQELRVPYKAFRRIWDETTYERNTGTFASTRAVMEHICKVTGGQADGEQLEKAASASLDFVRTTLQPRPDAVRVLEALRERGIKTALISNCSPNAEELWHETPFPPLFDVTVFSSSAGYKKPDSRIYKLALDKLGKKPGDCIFVGDGDSNELTGAREIGILPVMIQNDDEPEDAMVNRQGWDGTVIKSLSEILKLAGIV